MSARFVDTELWQDELVMDFSPEDRYFWLYLLTNPHSNMLGVYRVPVKTIAFEMGYSVDSVSVLLERFQDGYDLIRYEGGEVAIKNYLRYGVKNAGKPMQDALTKAYKEVKNKELVEWVYENIKDSDKVLDGVKAIVEKFVSSHTDARVINKQLDKPLGIDKNIYKPTTINTNTNTNTTLVPPEGQPVVAPEVRPEVRSRKIADEVKQVISAWNSIPEITHVERISQSSSRYTMLRARLDEYGVDKVIEAISRIRKSDFLLRGTDSGWHLTFDWFVKPSNFPKVLEGNYDNNTAFSGKKKSGSAYIDAINNRMSVADEWLAGRSTNNDG